MAVRRLGWYHNQRMRKTAVALISIAAAVVGCSQPPTLMPSPTAPTAQSRRPTGTPCSVPTPGYSIIYCFATPPDGNTPNTDLVEPQNATLLYGETYGGGATPGPSPNPCSAGCGTVYSVDPNSRGHDKVIHAFQGGGDGAIPVGGIDVVDGSILGTTAFGGSSASGSCPQGCGTIFATTTSGSEKILHAFAGAPGDGASPAGSVLCDPACSATGNITFYGTTEYGGSHALGTIYSFSLTASGSIEGYTVVYSFRGYPKDGAYPVGNLVRINSTLYGVTLHGGQYKVGTVFKLPLGSFAEAPIHSFQASEGDSPVGLAVSNPTTNGLFGTTSADGARSRGTVYAMNNLTGKMNWDYSFEGYAKSDGSMPYARPTYYKGSIYGTTHGGGSHGNGTVYKISATDGSGECVLHSFGPRPADGLRPDAPLREWGNSGELFGTTLGGGSNYYYSGLGTVFEISTKTARCITPSYRVK